MVLSQSDRAGDDDARERTRAQGLSPADRGRVGVCLPVGNDDALAARAVGAEADQLRLDPCAIPAGSCTGRDSSVPTKWGCSTCWGTRRNGVSPPWTCTAARTSRGPRRIRFELLTIRDEQQGVDSRGGSFLDPSADVRSANRNVRRPNRAASLFRNATRPHLSQVTDRIRAARS